MYEEHKKVVINAVYRCNKTPQDSDFEDYIQEGMWIYIEYFRRYRDPIISEDEVIKFNRLAGRFVYLDLRRHMNRERRGQQLAGNSLEELTLNGDEPAASRRSEETVEMRSQVNQLWEVLNDRERSVLSLRYIRCLSNREIGLVMGLSSSYVGAIRRSIQAKWLTLESESETLK
ncbi:sigma-70 family RNA polymerase sigma factor [Lacticaseibacillus zhaodongensis]|uniref:sigma-70 family RNA polymerase sigma factor n=1 Tax=Lacticaseibacillus zhaodongensis TaxID=2668065 RepID=UPI0018AFFF4D|nr:sigma-70 family RNA polymerase sigma factor [Lacticaseibacillus zhaodongensis]